MFERLTFHDDTGVACYRWKLPHKTVVIANEAISRLAAYEDSGLSPDEVQELAKAKAEGRLVELPCKMGGTVYAPRKSDLLECTVQWITVYNGITIAVSYECDYKCDGCPFNHPYSNYEAGDGGCEGEGGYGTIQLSAIGKTVFLTREAAEKALEVGE